MSEMENALRLTLSRAEDLISTQRKLLASLEEINNLRKQQIDLLKEQNHLLQRTINSQKQQIQDLESQQTNEIGGKLTNISARWKILGALSSGSLQRMTEISKALLYAAESGLEISDEVSDLWDHLKTEIERRSSSAG